MVNKTGVASVLVGLLILVGTWYLAYSQGGAVPLVASLVSMAVNGLLLGGLAWLGLFLLVLGVLILVI